MWSFLSNLYHTSKKYKVTSGLILLGVFVISVIGISRLQFEEDITRMLPSDEKIQRVSRVSQKINLMDRIIVNISFRDSTITNPQELIAFADRLYDTLLNDRPEHIKDIDYKVSDKLMIDLYDLFFDNLPLFLEKDDYKKIDERLDQQNIENSLQSNFKTLVSPASMAMKEYIIQDPLHFTPIVLDRLKTFQVSDHYEIYNSRILTKDQKNLSLFITPAYPSGETKKNSELIHRLNLAIDHLDQIFNHEIKAQYYGAAAVAVGNAQRIKKDISITISIAIIVLLVFMSIFFRKKSIFLILFLPAIFGGSIALSVLYLLKGKISAISLGIGSVLLGITVDYALHLFTHFRRVGNVKQVMRDIATPVLMSCLTTASAFLCLLFVSSRALQDLGLFAAISVSVAAFFSLIVLPHFLKTKDYEKASQQKQQSWIEKITAYPLENNKTLVLTMVIFTIATLFWAGKTSFEGDMDKMNYLSDELKQAEKDLNKIARITEKSVYVISTGDHLQQALRNNEKVIPTLEKLQQQGLVSQYSSVSKLMVSDSLQKVRINRWKTFWTQDKIARVKQQILETGNQYKFKPESFSSFFTLLEKNFETLQQDELTELRELFLDEFITENDDMTTLVTLLKTEEENKPDIYNAFAENNNIIVFDKKFMTDNLIRVLKDDFNVLVKISLAVVFVILLLSFGRIELALLTFIPMALSWIWTLGIMGIFGIKFTIFNIIISTFIFGLGIDYSIFIMRGLLQEYKYGVNNLPSYKTSIFLSAITTITGIGVLIFAKHPALQSMALLSIIGILSVIIISYTVEPALFKLIILNRKKKGKVAYSLFDAMASVFAWTIFILGSFFTTLVGFILFKILHIRNKKIKLIYNYSIVFSASSLFHAMFNIKKVIINPNREKLKKPAVIICNHQSHIDLIYNMMLSPKVIILTNDWVQKNKIYGKLVQMADFYPVSEGYEKILPKLQAKVNDGFSILVYPEGTRSVNFKMKRFHKGAFYLAEKLQLDILPIVLHGTGYCMTKGDDLLVKKGRVTANYLNRISPDNKEFGENYSERAKNIGRYFRKVYQDMRQEIEDTKYYRDKLIKNYIYKGPVLEWYLRVKLRLENNYELFNSLIPRDATIYDIGCGYGFLSYMLYFVSEERKITGVDYDCEKINVANHCNLKSDAIQFECADVTLYDFKPADVFVLSDVLHYIPKDQQEKIMEKCIENLNQGGMIIIRDANTQLQNRHRGTKWTEIFSTKILKFNKTADSSKELYFMSSEDIFTMFNRYNTTIEVIDQAKLTSNVIYVIRKE
ncbi:MAG: MMPL family transporter [Bacteroidales bacterium]|jgi:1-acyl-sn-glycerol-3-phosphate acyltransferase|nr:MMPL family transporter [Bacteroidales bacterium]